MIEVEQSLPRLSGISIVDFYADWCVPCKKYIPILDKIEKEFKDITIYKVDVDKNPYIASEYFVSSIPTVLIFKDGDIVDWMLPSDNQFSLPHKLKLLLDKN